VIFILVAPLKILGTPLCVPLFESCVLASPCFCFGPPCGFLGCLGLLGRCSVWGVRGGRFPVFGFSFGGVPCLLLFLLSLPCLVLFVLFLRLRFRCCRFRSLALVLRVLLWLVVLTVALVVCGFLVAGLFLRLVRLLVRCWRLVTLGRLFGLLRLVVTLLTSGSAVSFEAADSPASGLPLGSPVSVTVGLLPVGGSCEFVVYSLLDCWRILFRHWSSLACNWLLES